MKSSSVIGINKEPNHEIAYRYRLDINDGYGFSKKNFRTITEYFIPSSKICFNELGAFKSEKPRNLGHSKIFHRRCEPVTAINMSKELINQIENVVEKFDSPEETGNLLKINEEYQLLFKRKQPKTTRVGNEIVFIKDGFWDSYKTKGNNIIKKALVQYILDGTTSKETNLDDVIQLVQKLSLIEKESLVKSINRTLLIKDGKLTEVRSNAIKDIEKNHENQDVITSGILGGIGGAVISTVSRVHPVIGIGFGLFAGSALKYANCEYQKYNENQLWDQREKRAKTIFDMIHHEPENDTNLTNSY